MYENKGLSFAAYSKAYTNMTGRQTDRQTLMMVG